MKQIKNIFSVGIDSNRVYGLDILRALAIFFVMFGHSRYLVPSLIHNKEYMFFVMDGVTIFFVLSGFLIGGILIKILVKENSFSLSTLINFWMRRWFRTVPNYLLILATVLVIEVLNSGIFKLNNLKYFIFSQNLYSPHPSFFPEAWSLSIEEWFYLTLGSGLFISFKFRFSVKKTVLVWIGLIILGATFIRTYQAIIHDCADNMCWQAYVRGQVITRLDSLMIGVLAAYISIFFNHIWLAMRSNTFFLLGIFLICIPQLYDYFIGGMWFKNYLLFSFVSIGTFLLLPKATTISTGNGFLYRLVTVTSLISYSMYLVNYTLISKYLFRAIKILFPFFSQEILLIQMINYSLFWGITFIGSILLYKYFELPVTKLREKIKFFS